MIDLRSDTVTRPTDGMRRAMAEAEVGDDVYGEDPSVNRLQAEAAERMGTEAALFMPSGTMCNQVAIAVLSQPGTDVLAAGRAHVVRYEMAGAARNAGVQLKGLPDDAGFFTGADVDAALESSAHHQPPVSLVCIENTAQAGGGRPWRAGELADVAASAARHSLPVHCDGARIFNAAAAVGIEPRGLVEGCTTVMFCLSKGLGGPVGSVLCGPAGAIDEARQERRRLGGAMRQAGVLAAAGLYALEHHIERLAEDHARARRLADGVAECFPGSIDPDGVETNMVCCDASAFPEKFLARLADRGVLAGMLDPDTLRFTTHLDVDDDSVEATLTALADIARKG
ncbi:MAG: low specificity L-threonine aldolase [Actinobacteria bacterium]|nr:low specificity L-threonine aldolase [Actinomycetota bacterium]